MIPAMEDGPATVTLAAGKGPADSLQEQAEQDGRDARGRFVPGRSGNPQGRRVGSRNRATMLAEAMLDGNAEALVQTVIDNALYRRDPLALKLCFERLLAPRRNDLVQFELPPLQTAEDAVQALSAIAAAVGAGTLTPAAAWQLSRHVTNFVDALEAHDIEARIVALEANTHGTR